MKSPLVSFIVPLYNREQSIAVCLKSILEVDYDNFEVIVVDDGSTDESSVICDRLASSDKRLKYYCQSNRGVSAARNLGLSKACGSWVAFVDSDDAVLPSRLDIIKREIPTDVDILMVGYASGEWRNNKLRVIDNIIPSTIIEADNAARYLFGEYNPYRNIVYPIWNKLFRKDIMDKHGIRFDETMSFGEDQVFLCDYLYHAKGIIYNLSQSYLCMNWQGLSHLGQRMRTPDEFFFNIKKNYAALCQLNFKGGEASQIYSIVYGIDRPISRILFRYTQYRNRKYLKLKELMNFADSQIIPYLKSIPLTTESRHHISISVIIARKLLLKYGAAMAIYWCFMYNAFSFFNVLPYKVARLLKTHNILR